MHLFVSLLTICILGVFASYTDIKQMRIKNIHVAAGMVTGLALFLIFDRAYWLHYSVSVGTALVGGMLLWHFRFWTAGDAKLFLAMIMMIPPYSVWVPVPVFINTVLLAFGFLIVFFIWRLRPEHLQDAIQDSLQPMKILRIAIGIFGAMWAVRELLLALHLRLAFGVELLAVIAMYALLRRVLGKYSSTVFLGIAFARIILDPSVFTLPFLTQYLIMLLFFIIIRNFVGEVGEELFRRPVSPERLRPGMMLDKPLELQTDAGRQEVLPSVRGLTAHDIQTIRHAKTEIKYIYVQETLPFAPFIFAGVLVTFLLRGHGMILF